VRRRITIAIVGVVFGTLVLTVAGGLLLVRRAATSTAVNELVPQVQSLGQLLSTSREATDRKLLAVVKKVGSYEYLEPVGLSQSGSFSTPLPDPLTASNLDATALMNGQTVSGNVGNLVYVAVPITLTPRELVLEHIPVTDTPVLLVTREVPSPVNGVPYFLIVAGVVLAIAVAVAAFLARRISAPVIQAADATRKIATGDLEARVRVSTGPPELTSLGEAVNSLGESLGRSRGLERQFLMSVSHELRTPLTSIRGYADAVADGATDDVVGAAGVIASESRRLERLVKDLLDLARLDSRQFSLHMQRVDAAAIAEGVVDGSLPEASALGITLASRVPTNTRLWVDADPDRLAQIVANLIENAFKFASSRVEVGAWTDGATTLLWVDDDGPGIRPEDLPRVFERHFTSDRVPARRSGTGLGLAIVAELASAMGASVRAESPLPIGRGTRMVVWIASRAEPPPPPLPAPSPLAPPRSTADDASFSGAPQEPAREATTGTTGTTTQH
jgi:signal transduction histidine kinase